MKYNHDAIEQMRRDLADYDHDCKAGPEDGCAFCAMLFEADDKKIAELAHKIFGLEYDEDREKFMDAMELADERRILDEDHAYESKLDWEKEQSESKSRKTI